MEVPADWFRYDTRPVRLLARFGRLGTASNLSEGEAVAGEIPTRRHVYLDQSGENHSRKKRMPAIWPIPRRHTRFPIT